MSKPKAETSKELAADLRVGGKRVIYLEGKTDLEMFFGLLGVVRPPTNVHDSTLVKAVGGRDTVRRYLDTATQASPATDGVYGILDGDGADVATVSLPAEKSLAGRLFTWKAYSIESLLPRAGWPEGWPSEPDWSSALASYFPTVAFNILQRDVQAAVAALDLHKVTNPSQHLRTETEFVAAIAAGQSKLSGRDLVADFQAALDAVRAAFAAGLVDGLCLFNGKWLIEHFLPHHFRHAQVRSSNYRSEWSKHLIDIGGMAEVRDLWEQITGRLPS